MSARIATSRIATSRIATSRIATVLIALVLVFAALVPVAAQEKVALVIGNGRYEHASELPNPANDARAVAKAFGDLGFTVTQGVDLDRNRMERTIRDFLRTADSARVAVLFYAGHGMQVDGRNYLVPVDAKLEAPSDLNFETVELDRILSALDGSSRTAIVILDACRDNPLARSYARKLGATRSGSVPSGLAGYSSLGTGMLIAFATAPGQVALDGATQNSPFTQALLDHLRTPGLEVRQMLTRVRSSGAAATGNKQIPWDNSSLLGEVYLAGLDAGRPPPTPTPNMVVPVPPPPSVAPPSAAPSVSAVRPSDSSVAEMRRPIDQVFAAWRRLDLSAYLAQWAPEAIRIDVKSGKRSTFDQLARDRAQLFGRLARVDADYDLVHRGTRAGVAEFDVTYRMVFRFTSGRTYTERACESYKLRRDGARWLILENLDDKPC